MFDLVQFDRGTNFQKPGSILEEHFPLVTTNHGAEHCMDLFFKDVNEHWVMQLLIKACQKHTTSLVGPSTASMPPSRAIQESTTMAPVLECSVLLKLEWLVTTVPTCVCWDCVLFLSQSWQAPNAIASEFHQQSLDS